MLKREYYLDEQDAERAYNLVLVRNVAGSIVLGLILAFLYIYGLVITTPWFPAWSLFNWVPFTLFFIITLGALTFLNTYWQLHRMELRAVRLLEEQIRADLEAAYKRTVPKEEHSVPLREETVIEGEFESIQV